jgi:hypothetical protein
MASMHAAAPRAGVCASPGRPSRSDRAVRSMSRRASSMIADVHNVAYHAGLVEEAHDRIPAMCRAADARLARVAALASEMGHGWPPRPPCCAGTHGPRSVRRVAPQEHSAMSTTVACIRPAVSVTCPPYCRVRCGRWWCRLARRGTLVAHETLPQSQRSRREVTTSPTGKRWTVSRIPVCTLCARTQHSVRGGRHDPSPLGRIRRASGRAVRA